MTKNCPFILTVATAMMIGLAANSASALDLSNTLGGVTNTVGSVVGGVTNTTGDTVNTVVNGNISHVKPSSVLSVEARSTLLGGIKAKTRVLSPKQLLKLCLTVGGGNQGCQGSNRPAVLGIIDTRLAILKPNQLLNVCVSVGASCGNGYIKKPIPQIANLSDRNRMDEITTCKSVLHYPQNYESALVRMCKKVVSR